MAHFAKVVDGVVEEVIVAEQDFIDQQTDGTYIQTSYNTRGGVHLQGGTPLRGNFAAAGYIYDSENDVFYAPRLPQEASWVLNTSTWTWEPPIPRPADAVLNGGDVTYRWDEDTYQADNTKGWVVFDVGAAECTLC